MGILSYQASEEGVWIFKQGMEKLCMLAVKHVRAGMKSCLLHEFPSKEKQGYSGTIKLVTYIHGKTVIIELVNLLQEFGVKLLKLTNTSRNGHKPTLWHTFYRNLILHFKLFYLGG